MITIPENGRWTQNNRSDIGGALVASRNIDLTKPGYVKMADRVVSLKTREGDTNFNIVKYLEYFSGGFRVTTSSEPYNISLVGGISVAEDTSTNNPSGSIQGDAIFWNNRYYTTGSDTLTYKGSTGDWTTVTLSPTLTGSVRHPMCIFENRQTLVIGNGSAVKQINSDHVDTVNLTLPGEYQVSKIAYNNNRIGILTRLTNNNSVKDSMFFVWDGSSAEANIGIPIGSSQGVSIVPYRSSFVVVNGKGQLLYFNGSDLEELDRLPIDIYDSSSPDGNNNLLAVANFDILVDADTILFNIKSFANARNEYRQENSFEFDNGSVWAWSPSTGLYHRHSASSALILNKYFQDSDINTTTDVITVLATVPATGTPVRYIAGATVVGGLTVNKTYYTINLSTTTLKLATSKSNALAGIAVDLTTTGSAIQYLIFYPETDFGQSFVNGRTGCLRKFRTAGDNYSGYMGNVFFSNENIYTTASAVYAQLCATIPKLENRSWVVSSKVYAQGVLDTWQKIYLYFKPLVHDVDEIVVKFRTTDFKSLQQPVIIGATSRSCTWTSSSVFTTTDDFSSVTEGYEVEIIAGSGSGQTAHVQTITENAGTYTVTLDEEITGVVASNTSFVSVSNWKKIGTVTADTTTNNSGYAELAIPEENKTAWIQFKIELRGIEVELHKLQVINKPFKPSV